MGKIDKVLAYKLIDEVPDRDCNSILLEKTPHNYHVHFRNLKIELSKEEFDQWTKAFITAKRKVEGGDYYQDDTVR